MMMATGLGLVEIRDLPVENYLPALLLAPLLVWVARRFGGKKVEELEP
jgi:uncharacterized membrane protein YqgA involved in biofilm formation